MEEYSIQHIEPLETYSNTPQQRPSDEVKKLLAAIIDLNESVAKKLDGMISIWADFIKTIKDLQTVEEDVTIEDLAKQNEELIKQNESIISALESLQDSLEKQTKSAISYNPLPSYKLAPRKYPRIRIVK